MVLSEVEVHGIFLIVIININILVLFYSGNPKRSFDSCMESYKTIKEIFGIGSIEATEELCKLTQVLFRRYTRQENVGHFKPHPLVH